MIFTMIQKDKLQNVEREIEFYDTAEEDEHDSCPGESFNYVYAEFEKLKFRGLILEGGCGKATLGRKLLERNADISIVGVDISQKQIEFIEKLNLPRYRGICGNLENKQLFEPKTFDLVFFPYVLHHFPSIDRVIENAFYWLKENGYVIIIDPNGSNLILRLSYLLRVFLYWYFPKKIAQYASENEKHIPVRNFLNTLKPYFEIKKMCSFFIDFGITNRFNLIGLLVNFRHFLLKAYYNLNLSKFSGSDLMIVGVKRQEKL